MARENSKHDNHKKAITEMTRWLSRGSAKYKKLPTPRCGVPMDEGCTQPLSSGPKTHLNTTVFCFPFTIPFARNLHKLESLALTSIWSQMKHRVREGSNTHKSTAKCAHTRPRIELTRLSQSSHLEQSSNHLETQTNAQRLSVDDQECSKVACVSPPCA